MTRTLVLDTESTIYDKGNPFARRNRLMCVGVMDRTELRYFDIEHSGQPYGTTLSEVRELLERAELTIGFNIKHDLHWLRRYGLPVPSAVFDCQLAEFLLSNQRYPYPSLDSVAERYGFGNKLDLVARDYWDKDIDTPNVPSLLLKEYCLKDVELTHQIYVKQHELLTERGLMPLFRIQCQDLLVLAEMEWNGMRFDEDAANRLAEETTEKLRDLESQLAELAGADWLNWNSPLHVSAVLYGGTIDRPIRERVEKVRKDGSVRVYERNGTTRVTFPRLVKPLDRTEVKGREGEAWYVNEQVLRSLKATGPAARITKLLLQQAELDKLRGTYYLGIPELCRESDWEPGYIHGRFNQCVARTGRLSSNGPNLQNFASAIKPLFLSRNGVLVNTDAKGLEWVCAAYLSQDPVAIEEIIRGDDHHELNRSSFNLPTRLVAKVFMFRLIYGGSSWSFAHDPDFTDVSRSESFWQDVIDKTYAKYKGLHKWHTDLVRQVVDKGGLLMPTGRHYRFDRVGSGEWPRTQILNYPVQGFGADLLSIVRISLAKRLKAAGMKSLLICTVHDSILLDAVPEEVKPLGELIEGVFRDLPLNFGRVFKVPFNVPLRCETTVGPTWGDMKPIEEY